MAPRRLLAWLALIVLMLAPFGRIAAAEAMAAPHHPATAMPGHCDSMPMPDHGDTDRAAVDCMIACAVMTVADSQGIDAVPVPASPPTRQAIARISGLHPEADPPPPRRS